MVSVKANRFFKGDFNMELKGIKANFLGDSITEGVGTSSPEHIYFNVLKEKCGLKEARGYGVGGTRIARQTVLNPTDPFDRDFIMRTDEMDADADLVVVFGGTNDYGHGQAPLGSMSDRTVFTFYGALHNLIPKLIEKYPNGKIVFMTPLHRMCEDGTVGVWKPEGVEQKPLVDYVRAIKEVCEYYSVPVLDLFASSGIAGNLQCVCDRLMPDGLHPNDNGHVIIAAKLAKFLENL